MRRRANGEGTIYFDQSRDRWIARVSLPDGRRRKFTCRTRAEADERLTRAKRDRNAGLPVVSGALRLDAYLGDWLETEVRPAVRPGTYAAYSSHCRVHLIPALGKVPLAKLEPKHVQRLLNQLQDAGLSGTTVGRVRATLRRALADAERCGLVQRNVAKLVRPPKTRRQEVEPLSAEQARALRRAVEGDRLEALHTVALFTGLRQGELLGLQWVDVDLDKAKLSVRYQLRKVARGDWQLVEPKSERSRRTIDLRSTVVMSLRMHRARQGRERLEAGDSWCNSLDLVFTTSVGGPLDSSNVTHTFQRHLMDAGLPRKRFHDLRHTCASLLLASDESPLVVSRMLGHHSVAFTLDTYGHLMPGQGEAVADRMEELLGGS